MSDIERKVIIDTKDIDRADKEYKDLSDSTEKEQKEQTKSALKEGKKRRSFVRKNIADQIKAVRKLSKERVAQLNLALSKNEISERKHVKKVIEIRKKANKKIQQSRKKESSTKGSSGGAGGLFGKVPLIGKIAAGVAIIGKGLSAIVAPALKAEAQLEAFNQRAKVVFGETLPLVELAADRTAESLGLTKTAFLGVTGATADLLVPLGATRQEASEMAVETLELAAALKQFNGDQRDVSEVANILTKSYLGERDGLKSLGISIDDALIKQELLKRGTSKLTGEARALEVALVTQELLVRKSADAQASYAESTDNTQTRINELSSAWGELSQTGSSLIATIFKPFLSLLTSIIRGINATIQGTKELLNIGTSRAKAQQKEVLLVAQLSRELAKIQKIRNKGLADQRKQNKLIDELGNALESVGIKNASSIKSAKRLNDLSKEAIKNKRVEIILEVANKQAFISTSKARIKELNARNNANSDANNTLIKNRQKAIKDAKLDINEQKRTLKLLDSIGKARQKANVRPKSFSVSAPKATKAEKGEFEGQDTSLEALARQEEAIEQALRNTEEGLIKEGLLKEQARIDEQLAIQENFIEIDNLETERRSLQEALFLENDKKKKKQLKEELKQNQARIKTAKATEAQITKIKAENEATRAKIEEIGFEFGQALLSQEEGAFRKFLANQFRAFAGFLAKKASAEATLALATGNVGKAAALTAGAVAIRLLGEVGAKAIEGPEVKTPELNFGDTATAREATTIEPVTNTTINNIDNSTNVEVIETGTYFTESQMIRDRISPLLQQLDDSRGALQQ